MMTRNNLVNRIERIVDACCWGLRISRYCLSVRYPIIVHAHVPPNRLHSSVRVDIQQWCDETLNDQWRFDGDNRLLFKHKTGMAMFRMTWSQSVASQRRVVMDGRVGNEEIS